MDRFTRCYFLILTVLIAGPLTGYFVWHSKLPTEDELLKARQNEIVARGERARQLYVKLPPPGSIKENTIRLPLNPTPICDGKTGECNLQIAEALMIEDPARWSPQGVHMTNRTPSSLAQVLQYCIGQSITRHTKSNEKVWGFAATLDKGLKARYLVVNRHLSRETPKGRETTAIEFHLFDLDNDKYLGSFRYPDKMVTHFELGDRERFLSETLGGRITPSYPRRYNPRTNDIEWVTILVFAWAIVLGLLFVVSIPVAVMIRRQQRRVEAIKERGDYPDEMRCPVCLEMTDSLKRYSTLRVAFFIGIAGGGEKESVKACPRCMRRHLRKRFLVNLVPANLLMIFFGPMFLFQWLRTFRHGHSADAIEMEVKPID